MALEVRGKVSLDGSGFSKTLAGLSGQARKFGGDLKSQIAGAFTVGAIVAATKKTIEYGGRINDLSAKLNVSTKALQEFDYATKLNGGTLEDVEGAFRSLGKARLEALGNPGGDTASVFKLLGVDEASLKNNPLEETFKQIGETIRTTDFGAGEEGLLMKVLGKGGGTLIPAFKAGLKDAADEANNLGAIMDAGIVSALDDAGDSVDRLTARLRGPFAAAITNVAGFLRGTVNAIDKSLGAVFSFVGGAQAQADEQTANGGFFASMKPSAIMEQIRMGTKMAKAHIDDVNTAEAEANAPKTPKPERARGRSSLPGEVSNSNEAKSAAEKLLALELKLMDATERRAALEKQVTELLEKAALLKGKPEAFVELSKAADAAGALEGIDSQQKQEDFTAISDSLSRIGGFTGASGDPQAALQKTSEQTLSATKDILSTIKDVQRFLKEGVN